MDEDEDSFLYGDSVQAPPTFAKSPVTELQPVPLEVSIEPNGIVAHLEAEAVKEDDDADAEFELVGEEEEDEGDESEDDIEFIMEPTARSMDFRSQGRGQRPPHQPRSASGGVAVTAPNQANNLTTEYTPRERGGNAPETPQRPTSQPPSAEASQLTFTPQQTAQEQQEMEEGPDPSSLPPATAPPSHPSINPSIPGTVDGRSVFDVDLASMSEKPWRRPGSDLSDWFNYGFDEISWEAYCYRRREMGEMAGVLKTNVINFAGMPEDQLIALPPEVRTMVMTGATAMMGGGGPGPAMMAPGVGMNPMMHDMSGMGPMGMGPMGMGMNGEMGMAMPPSGPMMPDGPGPVAGPSVAAIGPGSSGTPEQAGGGQMNMQEGFVTGGPGPGMMGMNMGGEFGMQEANPMGPQMYPGMESNPTPVAPVRGGPPGQFRGRGMGPGMRGRGSGFMGRGRGRGGMYVGSDGMPQPLPVRPASPLPPGVPTGPRNPGNRYKDRDNNAPAVDGLDYGGTNKDGSGGGTPFADLEEKSNSRKRRSSPMNDDDRSSRSSKRR